MWKVDQCVNYGKGYLCRRRGDFFYTRSLGSDGYVKVQSFGIFRHRLDLSIVRDIIRALESGDAPDFDSLLLSLGSFGTCDSLYRVCQFGEISVEFNTFETAHGSVYSVDFSINLDLVDSARFRVRRIPSAESVVRAVQLVSSVLSNEH